MSESVQQDALLRLARRRRPWFLRLLCMLSLINGISNISIYMGTALGGPVDTSELDKGAQITRKIYAGSGFESIARQHIEFQQALNHDVIRVSLMLLVFYIMSTLGAFRMYQLRRDGFAMYVIAQVLICVAPVVLVVANSYTATAAGISGIFAAIFIAMYASQLRYMQARS
jgi:hypothetical protein